MRLTIHACVVLFSSGLAVAQTPLAQGTASNEAGLGEFVVTGIKVEHVTKLAVLPSLVPDFEDVIVRSVVRRDFELSGMFDLIPESKAPPGNYQFDDPVDVGAWKKLGAEVIIKVAARKTAGGKVEVFGLAYFPEHGKEPVYERRFQTPSEELRMTAHRVTDALLGAVTGRPGGFSSRFAFSTKWGRGRRLFVMDADGEALSGVTAADATCIAPAWGPEGSLFYPESRAYAPFQLMAFTGTGSQHIDLPFKTSIYAVAFHPNKQSVAVAVAENAQSHIYVGTLDSREWKKVSSSEIATSPAYSPSGALAWIGGGPKQGSQRVYVDGKAVSPDGYTAAQPTFCDTEDGIRLVYSVAVGNDRQDLVMSDEHGRGLSRLTQGQGSNYAPACSPDGRLLAFFSTRTGSAGLQMMSLKRFTTLRVNGQLGDSLDWAVRPASQGFVEMKVPPKAAAPPPPPVAPPPAPPPPPVAAASPAPVKPTGTAPPPSPAKPPRRKTGDEVTPRSLPKSFDCTSDARSGMTRHRWRVSGAPLDGVGRGGLASLEPQRLDDSRKQPQGFTVLLRQSGTGDGNPAAAARHHEHGDRRQVPIARHFQLHDRCLRSSKGNRSMRDPFLRRQAGLILSFLHVALDIAVKEILLVHEAHIVGESVLRPRDEQVNTAQRCRDIAARNRETEPVFGQDPTVDLHVGSLLFGHFPRGFDLLRAFGIKGVLLELSRLCGHRLRQCLVVCLCLGVDEIGDSVAPSQANESATLQGLGDESLELLRIPSAVPQDAPHGSIAAVGQGMHLQAVAVPARRGATSLVQILGHQKQSVVDQQLTDGASENNREMLE
jgi:TolB protein